MDKTITGKRSLQQMGGGEESDAKRARTEDTSPLPPTVVASTRPVHWLDLPYEVLDRITRMLVPDSPFPVYLNECKYQPISSTVPTLRVLAKSRLIDKAACDSVARVLMEPGLHEFRLDASMVEYFSRRRHNDQVPQQEVRQFCTSRYAIDPESIKAVALPQRAVWHETLSTTPDGHILMNGAINVRPPCSGQSEALALGPIRTQHDVNALAGALHQRAAVVHELGIAVFANPDLSNLVGSPTQCKQLDLSNLAASLSQCNRLSHLVIQIDGPLPASLLDAMNSLKDLRRIRLMANSFPENLVEQLVKLPASFRLEALELSSKELAASVIEALTLARASFPALRELSLFTEGGLLATCMPLVKSFTCAPQSDFSGGMTSLKLSTLGPIDAQQLAQEVRQTDKVRRIGLSLTGSAGENAVVIKDLLNCKNIECLTLSAAIDDATARAIGEALKDKRGGLRELALRRTSLSDAGMAALAEGLQLNRSLREFMLTDTRLTASGVLSLGAALIKNAGLLSFVMKNCPMPPGTANLLTMTVAANSTLTNFAWTGGTLSAQEKQLFADAVCKNSALLALTLPPVEGGAVPAQQARIEQRLAENRMR